VYIQVICYDHLLSYCQHGHIRAECKNNPIFTWLPIPVLCIDGINFEVFMKVGNCRRVKVGHRLSMFVIDDVGTTGKVDLRRSSMQTVATCHGENSVRAEKIYLTKLGFGLHVAWE
jgi:hypothetical protein